ncbi:hypothetical protein [Actinomadura hibisca]|uniref:hypothetical protein n=1 Tax=Actinomadura hibisca TaxID=68565 RepID=UPI000833EB5E|nr:hypothetical protein [Actinomadura hibisca]
MIERRLWEPPRLYSWDVEQGGPGGVTDDPERAIDHVNRALADAPPGTRAVVREVALGCAFSGAYRLVANVGTARRGAGGGVVVWEF